MTRLVTGILAFCCLCTAAEVHPRIVPLHESRMTESDLEVGGLLGKGTDNKTRYVLYADLLKLPQVSYEISDDSNFKEKTRISGVELDELKKSLNAVASSDLVVAICNDGYRASYPTEYRRAHRPLLVLKVNDRPPADWPKSHDGGGIGPYLISHPKFSPSFKILSHTDEPQIPYGVTRLEFRDQRQVFGAIRPRGRYPREATVWEGYRIAQQNCFRCHNYGQEGGRMAGHPWQVLGAWAAADPAHFRAYVRNPRAVNAAGHMPGNPQYDDVTIEAIRQYFATFAAGPTE
jgi:mono/diheme cytochrome c family protein